MNSKIDINVCYRIIFEALASGKGMQAMTEALFEYTKWPIHVVDISFNVLAAAYGDTTGSKHIDENIKAGFVPADVVIDEYYRQGYIDITSNSEKSVIIDWGVVEKAQATGAIRINGNIEGMCATTYGDPALAHIALQVNDLLCKALAVEMEREHLELARATDPIRQVIARELFWDILPEGDKKGNRGFVDRGRLKPPYVIAIFSSSVLNNARIQHIRNAILSIFPDAFYVVTGGYLYTLFANLPHTNGVEFIAKPLKQLLKRYQCYCGISDVFMDLAARSDFRLGAQKALEVGQALHPDKNLFMFNDYYLEIVASYAVSGLGEFGYRLPELERLRAVDKEKKTDYYNTLKTYLVLNNNIKLTARKLHIHRNTLFYRLSKIREITGQDINDPTVIRRLLTGMTLRYVDQTIRHRVDTSSSQTTDFWDNK